GSYKFQPSQFPIIHQPIREKTCAELLAEEQEANINTQPFHVHKNSELGSWDHPTICYNDDDNEDYTIEITLILSTKEPDNSLSIGDEHLDTILATKLDEFIKSSVENLVSIPSESEGKDCAQTSKNQSKPDNVNTRIEVSSKSRISK
nr:hypothetical protein [Tanacetum cinerariifolium]